jgi:hypothetical protein
MNRSVTAVLRDEVLHANQAIPRARLRAIRDRVLAERPEGAA